jgi:hypothetical protein
VNSRRWVNQSSGFGCDKIKNGGKGGRGGLHTEGGSERYRMRE